jgi:hypothetical protein
MRGRRGWRALRIAVSVGWRERTVLLVRGVGKLLLILLRGETRGGKVGWRVLIRISILGAIGVCHLLGFRICGGVVMLRVWTLLIEACVCGRIVCLLLGGLCRLRVVLWIVLLAMLWLLGMA